MLVCKRDGCPDCYQRPTHARPTASSAVADRKNSTSVVVDIVDIVDSSHVTSVVVVVPFSCFLLDFGCRFFLGPVAFLCFLLCLEFCFCTRIMQFLCLGGGRFILPRCRRGGQCVCLGPPGTGLVIVSAYADRLPKCSLLIGICVRRGLPLLASAKKVFFPLRTRE